MTTMMESFRAATLKALNIDPKRPCTCFEGKPPLWHPYLPVIVENWCPLHGHGDVRTLKGPA